MIAAGLTATLATLGGAAAAAAVALFVRRGMARRAEPSVKWEGDDLVTTGLTREQVLGRLAQLTKVHSEGPDWVVLDFEGPWWSIGHFVRAEVTGANPVSVAITSQPRLTFSRDFGATRKIRRRVADALATPPAGAGLSRDPQV